MKKKYDTPLVEVEYYSLNTSIANNCANVVNNGPQWEEYQQCSDYKVPFSLYSVQEGVPNNVSFYEGLCDCYTTGSDGQYWTS